MGQAEVIAILEQSEEWMEAKKIAEKLNLDNASQVRRALKKMFDYGEIHKREIIVEGNRKFIYRAQ